MAVTYTADQVALIIDTLTARNGNESQERLPREEQHSHIGQRIIKSRSHAENLSRSSTNITDDDRVTTDNVGTLAGAEESQDPKEKSTDSRRRRIQDRESNSHSKDSRAPTAPPPPLKKRGPKPSTEEPVSKRAAQNRAAQRAHRERKEHYVKSLEDRIVTLESESEVLCQRNAELQAQLDDALAALSQDKARPDCLATSESTAPLAASGAHEDFYPTSWTSTTPVTDIETRGIAGSTTSQVVEEIPPTSVWWQTNPSEMAETIGNTDLRSPEIQAILENPDNANVGSSGTDWERFWTAWDSQNPVLDNDFDDLCCQAQQLRI